MKYVHRKYFYGHISIEILWDFVLLATALRLSKAGSSIKYIISGIPERNLNSFTDHPYTNFRNSLLASGGHGA